MVSLCVPGLQTRLESTPSWETSPGTSSNRMRKSANGGKLEVVDINKKKSEIEVKELKSLSQAVEGVKEKFPGLVHWRIPVCNSAAPKESDFDIICKTLLGTSINTPIIISDQVGLSRATTGRVIACLFKEFQIS